MVTFYYRGVNNGYIGGEGSEALHTLGILRGDHFHQLSASLPTSQNARKLGGGSYILKQ